MRAPVALIIAISVVAGSSLFMLGPFSFSATNTDSLDHGKHLQVADAAILPLSISDQVTSIELAGDAKDGSKFMKIDQNFVDPENHCEFCTRIEYRPGAERVAGFAYQESVALDLSGSKKISFWAMGEKGDENIRFKIAGKPSDKIQDSRERIADNLTHGIFANQKFGLTTEQVKLTHGWKKYEIDLKGIDLKGITHPFAIELSASSASREVVYLKGIIYSDEPAQNPLTGTAEQAVAQPLSSEIISNATQGSAPTSIEFRANVTGGTEPYSIKWNFPDAIKNGTQEIVHTFLTAGSFNVTLQVTDSTGNNASDSMQVDIAEANDTEKWITGSNITDLSRNVTSSNATTTEKESNSNSTDTNSEQLADEEPTTIHADAGIDISAHPGDSLVLQGKITGVDLKDDTLQLRWSQIGGSKVEIDEANSLTPRILLPDLDKDFKVNLEFTTSLEGSKDSDTVTVFVQNVPTSSDSNEEEKKLHPVDSITGQSNDECNNLVDCISDDTTDTFAVASMQDSEKANLFSFDHFNVENADIEYVTAVAVAKTDKVANLYIIGADERNPDHQSNSLGAIQVSSESSRLYSYLWRTNPVTDERWTADSLNSFVAGYRYGAGQSDIEISEFYLVVTYNVEEPDEQPTMKTTEQLDNQTSGTNSTITNSTQ